jgi:hypothetical protein
MNKPYKVLATSLLAGAMFSSSSTAFAEETPVPASEETPEQTPTYEPVSNLELPPLDLGEHYIPFNDVKYGTEAFDAIKHYSQVGAVRGIKSDLFGVNEPIKRVDAAVILGNINPLPYTTDFKKATFKDLPSRAVEAVSFLQYYNVVQGRTATYFGADLNITRGEAVMMIYRAYKDKLAEESSSSASFTDVPVIWEPPTTIKSKYFSDVTGRYVEAVDALVEAGVIKGKSADKFGTYQNITRSELVIILYRLDMSIYDIPLGDSTSIEIPSSANGVTIKLDKETYSPSETLKVTLTNTSDYTQVGIFNDFDLKVKKNGIWQAVPWNPEIASNQEIVALNAKNGVINSHVAPYVYFKSEKFPVGEYRLIQTFEKVKDESTTAPFVVAAKFKITE